MWGIQFEDCSFLSREREGNGRDRKKGREGGEREDGEGEGERVRKREGGRLSVEDDGGWGCGVWLGMVPSCITRVAPFGSGVI